MKAPDLDPMQYARRFRRLVRLALAHHVPMEEAQALAHEVLLGSLRQLNRIKRLDPWLDQALKSAIAIRNAGGATGV